MKKKEYLGKLETLSSNIDNWIDTTYIPECMKNATAFKYNSIRTALIITWFDAINICIENLADDTFAEDEMPFDVDDYLKFFEKHTLDDCAETFLCFRHPDRFDPFGFSEDGFLAQIELLNTIIEEIKKDDN